MVSVDRFGVGRDGVRAERALIHEKLMRCAPILRQVWKQIFKGDEH